jgi:outer membrane protein assembly factor BamB
MNWNHAVRFRSPVGVFFVASLCSPALFAAEQPAAVPPAAEQSAAEQSASEQAPAAAQGPVGSQWANWRGPRQTSVSTDTGLPDSWDPKGGEGSNLLWKRSDLGTRSTPIVMNGKLYVLTRDRPGSEIEGERVVCVDAATGQHIWQHRFNVSLTEVPDTRVAWSSVVGDPETGRVYAQGVCGYFCCLEGDTGKVVWERSLHEELGIITTFGGRTNVPVVFDDLVLISAVLVSWGDKPEFDGLARPAHRFMAFDKATGELRWVNSTNISPPDTTYSTPYVGVVGGEAQLIFGGADGRVWSMQPRTGKVLWSFPLTRRGINTSPLVVGTTVYASHSEENVTGATLGAVAAIDATLRGDLAGKEKWFTYAVMSGKSSPVMVDGKLWTVDDRAKLNILDPADGKLLGKVALGAVMRSTPVYGDGKAYVCTNSGQWYILKPTARGADKIHKLRLAEEENDGSPIIAGGRVYLPTSEAIYCIGPKTAPAAAAEPPAEKEPAVDADPKPALVQLVPYDATLAPEQTQQYKVRLYNARGQFLRLATPEEVVFRVEGTGENAGEIGKDGLYKASKRAAHVGDLIFAKVGELEDYSRVRIVPPLPWQFNFNADADLPISWVGGRLRYKIEDVGGEKAAVKKSVLPTPTSPNNKLGTNSKMFMGPSSLSDYTIEADVRLSENNKRLPDAGLINSGYTLCLRSQNELLRLYSWSAHDFRTFAETKFVPQPDKWYRMKLRVQQQKKSAKVQGKMWLRDQPEPEEWMVEIVDKSPVRSGSPGLYGNSQEAEFAVDNISVIPNSVAQTPAPAK